MKKAIALCRAIASLAMVVLAIAVTIGLILEMYRTSVDAYFGTRSQVSVSDASADDENTWNYQSEFTTAQEAYEGWRDFALEEAPETFVLLKNDNNALPMSATAKITMFGVRSYAPVYGSSGGSIADGNSTVEITQAFEDAGFAINPSMMAAYEAFFEGQEWATPQFGSGTIPQYNSITAYDDPHELTLEQLAGLNADYNSQYEEYGDAAIVVVGRPGGEGGDGYYPGSDGLADGVSTVTGNILSLSENEMAILKEAEDHFDTVIVLVNATNPMEIANIQDDPNVDAILWIGFPGAYGFTSVAQILNGTLSPSGQLGDVYAKNSALAPAVANYGNIAWADAGSYAQDAAVNSYLIDAEGIYTGYRYYETRYADIVMGNGGSDASAGTYANDNGTVASVDGTWRYDNEVVYPFGYGLSYTTFSQTLDSVSIYGDKKSADVTVTVINTGDVAGKSVIQLYASTPYTDYDKANAIEKSAIQLIDFEKTATLSPGSSQTITMNVDLSNLASYDANGAKTFIVDDGDYQLAIGNDAHDALNNVLAALGYSTDDGMTANGDVSKVYQWTWGTEVGSESSGDNASSEGSDANSDDGVSGSSSSNSVTASIDSTTFATSANGTPITNQLSDGQYSMDLNTFEPGTVTYLTRSDWDGTFPVTYAGLSSNEALEPLLSNDFIELTSADTSEIVFGDTSSDLTLNDMKGAAFDDERWEELLNKVTVEEFMTFAENAFHMIAGIESVGFDERIADDGPGGSDSHYLNEGQYQGVAYADAEDYADKSSRVCPSPTNLAYSWNKELAYRNGQLIIGETSLVFNLGFMCGPAMNLHRHAYNARAVEYYSEDPILSGFIGSAVTQGAQSKGTLVNVKHFAFNDQEINRSGVAVFMNEQTARELELRNFQQVFEKKGIPASFANDAAMADAYDTDILGVMTSYNRIGAVASSANAAVMVIILRQEWGFTGYNVTDFTSVSIHAAPKESVLAGTTAFCGFGNQGVTYWDAATLGSDLAVAAAIRRNMHYNLWALANSNNLNGVNSTTHVSNVLTWWRTSYLAASIIAAALMLVCLAAYAWLRVKLAKVHITGGE